MEKRVCSRRLVLFRHLPGGTEDSSVYPQLITPTEIYKGRNMITSEVLPVEPAFTVICFVCFSLHSNYLSQQYQAVNLLNRNGFVACFPFIKGENYVL